jgi:hypothetical protein
MRFLHTFPVEAFMIDELGIFGGDDGALQVDGNSLIGHPLLLELGIAELSGAVRPAESP